MFRVELNRGVTVGLKPFNFIDGSVKLGDNQVLDVLDFLSKLSPNRFKITANATPWSIIQNKNVLFRVIHYICPGRADKGSEAISGQYIGRFFGLEPGLYVSSFKVTNELLNIRDSHILYVTIVDELKLAFVRVEDAKRWHHKLLNFHEIG